MSEDKRSDTASSAAVGPNEPDPGAADPDAPENPDAPEPSRQEHHDPMTDADTTSGGPAD